MEKEILQAILAEADLSGFTHLLKGERLCRYVVCFTNNKEFSIDLLVQQINHFYPFFDVITIGGRGSPTGDIFVDVGTAVDNLKLAQEIGADHEQQAIWDTVEECEIRL